MRQDTTMGGGDGRSEPGEPTAARAASTNAVELHASLARFAAAIATVNERPERGPPLRAQAESLLRAVARRRRENVSARTEAQAGVAAFVARLRADGTPPERMLVVVKAAVRDVTPGVLSQGQLHAMTEDVVRWSIEAYYAA